MATNIRLFLIDGTAQGMREAEVGNWNGIALVCARTDLQRIREREKVRRTGIYILVGRSETALSGQAVYVGEADDVGQRLVSHDSKKDFWDWVVAFVSSSKEGHLTKAHVRWLEATLVREIKDAKRAELKNANEPDGGHLPEAEVADMSAFLENVRLLLPTLGVNVFALAGPVPAPRTEEGPTLELKWEDARAECAVRNGQFVVAKGSTARVKEVDSLPHYLRDQRRRLREQGVLTPVAGKEGLLEFTQELPIRFADVGRGCRRGQRPQRTRALEGEGRGGLLQGMAGAAARPRERRRAVAAPPCSTARAPPRRSALVEPPPCASRPRRTLRARAA